MTDVLRQHIEIVAGAGGPKARIAGHRVRVEDVVIWHERLGMSPDEIVDAIPTLTLADVHAALAYSWDHRDEIEDQIAAGRAATDELRRLIGPGPLAEKLRRGLSRGADADPLPAGRARRPRDRACTYAAG